jgi:hypothetical protein
MLQDVKLMIRAQAKNGMFLGPDSYNGAVITISNAATKAVLATGLMDTGDSGTRLPSSTNSTSPFPITTPTTPKATEYWVKAAPSTVGFEVTLPDIALPIPLEISAKVPMTLGQDSPSSTVTLELIPDKDYSQHGGIVIAIPGLWVQPEILTLGNQLRLRAKVTMLCGCMINANSPWLPEDFEVRAKIVQIGPPEKPIGDVPMTFQINSQFYANVSLPAPSGFQIILTATQKSSGMQGIAVVRL